jgi:GNAT superfamily N-acetyltransferase
VNDELTMRSLRKDQWPEAMTLAARSFLKEPFMIDMFGIEPLRRFTLAHRFYRSSPWQDKDDQLGAFIGDVLVGLCLSSPPGQCHLCENTDPAQPPTDPLLVSEWQFEVNVQAAHADQGTHAWMRRIAVDPALQGAGIGRALIAQALDQLRGRGAPAVLLECQNHREDFYVACGFRRVDTVPEATGPVAILMRADLNS